MTDSSQSSYPVVVVCPECSAIYTPDVEGINADLAEENQRLRDLVDRPADRRVIVCNYAISRSAIPKGAKTYLSRPNPGGGFDRNLMLVRSRGGRLIEQWEAAKNLEDWRVKALPPVHPLYGDERIWDFQVDELVARLQEVSRG